MTLDRLAGTIQRDLARMATKDDLQGLATKQDLEGFATKADIGEIHAEIGGLRERMATKEDAADLGDRIFQAKEAIQEQIAGLKYAKEIDELRARVVRVEQKLGLKRTPAA